MSNPIDIQVPNSSFSDHSISDEVIDNEIEYNEEINLYLKMKTIVTVKVKKSDKIKEIKRICSTEGVSENLLDVYHAGDYLDDNQTFNDYGIGENSTLTLFLDKMSIHARRLIVKIPSQPQSNMVFVANVLDTVNAVKSIIVTRVGVNSEEFDLMFNGRFLETHETIHSLNLENESILYLIQHPQEAKWISIFTPNGLIPLQIRPLQTVGYCKSVIGSMINTSVDNAVFLREGEILDDSRTFASYNNIVDDTHLVLMYGFEVLVELWSGKTITLNLFPMDDANTVNRKVSAKVNVPVFGFPVYFQDERLENGRDLNSYGIQMNSMIKVGHPSEYFS